VPLKIHRLLFHYNKTLDYNKNVDLLKKYYII
jgi:hypothetical protein